MWAWWQRKKNMVPLVFRWRKPHGLSFRLGLFLLSSVVIHLAAFYAFEVVYPPNRKDLIRDGTLWLLSSEEPTVRAVLARHEAALQAFSGLGSQSTQRIGPKVTLRSTLDRYEPNFMPLPVRSLEQALVFPDAVPKMLPVLSIEDTRANNPPESVVRSGIGMIWADGQIDDIPLNIQTLAGAASQEGWLFGVAYGADRRVREAVVLHGPGTDVGGQLRRWVLSLSVPKNLPAARSRALAWTTLRLHF